MNSFPILVSLMTLSVSVALVDQNPSQARRPVAPQLVVRAAGDTLPPQTIHPGRPDSLGVPSSPGMPDSSIIRDSLPEGPHHPQIRPSKPHIRRRAHPRH